VGNFSLPKRHFTKGTRKLVGFRLPDELKKKIETLADDLGWTITDVAQTALDQYVHEELPKTKDTKQKSKD
jgi:predicted transcriptional regulator